jgi:hypothetical protein
MKWPLFPPQDDDLFFIIQTNPMFPLAKFLHQTTPEIHCNIANMFSQTNLLSTAYAMAVFTPAIAAWATQVEHCGLRLKLVHGEVNANSDVSKRNDIPPERQFGDSHSDWTYIQITGLSEGTACFGYDNATICDSGTWSDPDWTDIQIAMTQQTTLDGKWQARSRVPGTVLFFLGDDGLLRPRYISF